MIVTCERCATQFQLDESRVPEGGVRVRCSRCKYSFAIEPPGRAPAEEGGAGLVEKRDLEAGRGPQGPPPGLRLGGAPEEAAAGAETEEEESDWQFNEDLPSEGDASIDGRVAAANVVDQLLGASPAAKPAPTPSIEDDDSIPSLDLDASGLDLAGDLSGESAAPPAGAARGPAPAEAVPSAPQAAAPPPDELDVGDGSDELEGPEDWGLLDEEESGTAPGPAVPTPAAAREPLRVAPDLDPADFDDMGSRWGRGPARLGNAAGWLGVVALIGFGLWGALGPRPPAAAAMARPSLAPGLELAATDGRWIENAIAGPVYVVSGRVRNAGSRPVAAPPLAVEILDAEGRVIAAPAPVWSLRSARELREAPPETLARGRSLGDASGRIPPGVGSFDAVLDALPPGAADFRIVRAPAGLGREVASRSARRDAPAADSAEAPSRDALAAPATSASMASDGVPTESAPAGESTPPAAPAP